MWYERWFEEYVWVRQGKDRFVMKILLYEVREDEKADIDRIAKELKVEVVETGEVPSLENAGMAEGCDGVSILGQGTIDVPLLDVWKKLGVECLSTRTIGFNHIDVAYAKSIGIHVCNASYEPDGVSDFTIMMMLMCLRNYKQALWRGQVNDFALKGLMGRELKHMTVGVIGTGKIGAQVIRSLSGFGCRILAVDPYEKEEVKKYATYVDRETVYREADIITLHLPLTPENYHMLDRETIAKMKDGVILINCARGELVDIDALVEGIESEKIGALGLDTVEGEEGIIHEDHRIDILKNRNWFYLHQFRNVIMTQHMAFYTEQAVDSMVQCGVEGLVKMAEEGSYKTMLNK